MPMVTIAARALPEEKKPELVRKVTEAVVEAYEMAPETVTVIIQEYPLGNIGVGGVLVSERGKGSGAAGASRQER